MSRSITLMLCLFISFNAKSASVWQVSSDNQTMYIGGTIHVLSSSDYPLPPQYDEAYRASAKIVFETDMAALQSVKFQQDMMRLLTYQDGGTFKDELSSKTVQALEKHFSARAIPIDNLLSFKPSLLAITLSNIELQVLGLTSEGVDRHFANRAIADNRKIGWLESPEA